MDAFAGSWQYENISSANEISLSPPSSPTLYFDGDLMQSLDLQKDLLSFEDASPFIGNAAGAQLLSSANCANLVAAQPSALYDFKPIKSEEFAGTDIFAAETESQGIDIDIDSIVTGDHAMIPNVEDVSLEIDNLHRLLAPQNAPADPALELSTEYPVCVSETAEIPMEDIKVGSVEVFQVTQEELEGLIGQCSNVQSPSNSFYDEENSQGTEMGSLHEFEDIGDQLRAELDMDIELAYEAFDYSTFGDEGSSDSSANSSDAEDETQEQVVDALLRNDLPAAQEYLEVSTFGTSKNTRRRSSDASDPDYKPARRGRKPTSVPPTSWKNVKDKSQRKKQQNRAAASKYRQKKKEEQLLIEEREKVLESEYQALLEKKARLLHESTLIKKLLREKLAAQK